MIIDLGKSYADYEHLELGAGCTLRTYALGEDKVVKVMYMAAARRIEDLCDYRMEETISIFQTQQEVYDRMPEHCPKPIQTAVVHAGGLYYPAIVSERVMGKTIRELFWGQNGGNNQGSSYDEKLEAMMDLLSEHGLYDNDIGGNNIMFCLQTQKLKIVDFGQVYIKEPIKAPTFVKKILVNVVDGKWVGKTEETYE